MQWFMVAVVVVLLGACYGEDHAEAPAEELSASKGEGDEFDTTTPVAVVSAFFKAIETDDRKTMASRRRSSPLHGWSTTR